VFRYSPSVIAQRISSRFESVIKGGVACGVVPFDWGAARNHRAMLAGSCSNPPTSFSEKVRHKLVYDRRPILKIYADKIAVRDYVRAICPAVKLPHLLGTFATADSAVAGTPRGPWAMKASHGSSMVLICRESNLSTLRDVRRRANEWLATDYGLRYWEWQYFSLPKRVMFEEYLGDEAGVPADYKFYVMHQKVRFIEVDQGRFTHHTRDIFFPDWTPLPSRVGSAPVADRLPSPPPRLEQMIEIAETLARDSDFLRVDLYAVRGSVYFGELTHSPAAGNFGFADPQLDRQLGSDWQVPSRYR
jgi:hypothetical protein